MVRHILPYRCLLLPPLSLRKRGHSSRLSGFCASVKGDSLEVSFSSHGLIILKPLSCHFLPIWNVLKVFKNNFYFRFKCQLLLVTMVLYRKHTHCFFLIPANYRPNIGPCDWCDNISHIKILLIPLYWSNLFKNTLTLNPLVSRLIRAATWHFEQS